MDIPANRPTTLTCAALIMGTFLLIAIPPLGLIVMALGIIPQMLHRNRTHRVRDARIHKAQTVQRREKILAVKSLGL